MEIFHIYNRGTEKRNIFENASDYQKFKDYLKKYSESDKITLISYCFNPNHFHLIIGETEFGEINKFIQRLATAYTMYFNTKYERTGALFQGHYKSVLIKSNEDLLWVFAYVTANAFIHGLCDDWSNYKWSAASEYLESPTDQICFRSMVRSQFKDVNEFREYVTELSLQMIEKKKVNNFVLEENPWEDLS